MKKFLPALLLPLLMAATAPLTSCNSDDNTADVTYSSDCLITAVTMGSLKGHLTTKNSKGEDSTYTFSVTGSLYPVMIDQLNSRIYNPDSLPVGTDMKKVAFTTFNNSYRLTIKSLATDRDTTFTPTDSTDFSRQRTVTVYSEDGQQQRNYAIDLRVHREHGDSVLWQQIVAPGTSSPLTAYVKSRALTVDGQLYVFGQKADGTAEVITSGVDAPDFTHATSLTTTTGAALDIRSIQHTTRAFFARTTDGRLVTAAKPADAWRPAGTDRSITALAGTWNDSLYAIVDGTLFAATDGTGWRTAATDAGEALPVTDVVMTAYMATTGSATATRLLAGLNASGQPSLWCGYADTEGRFGYSWISLPQTEELGNYTYPTLAQPALVTYDNAALLTGLTTAGSVAPFYLSRDNGRTWKTGELPHPALTGATALALTVDADHYLWVFCGGTGAVYKGRLNRLGWTVEQTRFDKARKKGSYQN